MSTGIGTICPSEKLTIEDAKLTGCHGIGINTTNLDFHLLVLKCKCGSELVMKGKNWVVDFRGETIFTCGCGEKITINPSLLITSEGNVGININNKAQLDNIVENQDSSQQPKLNILKAGC